MDALDTQKHFLFLAVISLIFAVVVHLDCDPQAVCSAARTVDFLLTPLPGLLHSLALAFSLRKVSFKRLLLFCLLAGAVSSLAAFSGVFVMRLLESVHFSDSFERYLGFLPKTEAEPKVAGEYKVMFRRRKSR